MSKNFHEKRLLALIDRLCHSTVMGQVLCPPYKRRWIDIPDWQKPGGIIKDLHPQELELLKQAKGADFNHRILL
jgi:hypothetical protein